MTADFQARAKRIRLLVLDVDGVLTDGRLYYADDGTELKAFHIHDGLGIKMLQATGVEVAIITGRTSRAVQLRAANLGIPHVFQGVADKQVALEQLVARVALDFAAVGAMGDDLPDLSMLRRCGLAISVPQAPLLLRQHAHYVTQHSGGMGAVREVCEMMMEAQGTLENQMREFLE